MPNVFQHVLARRIFSAISVGSVASNQENVPHLSGSRTDFQCLHQAHFFKRIVANMSHVAKALPVFTVSISHQSLQWCLISSVNSWVAQRSKSTLFCGVGSPESGTDGQLVHQEDSNRCYEFFLYASRWAGDICAGASDRVSICNQLKRSACNAVCQWFHRRL